jgi:hypothetical protein
MASAGDKVSVTEAATLAAEPSRLTHSRRRTVTLSPTLIHANPRK